MFSQSLILTHWGILTQLNVKALKALFGSPSIVSSFHNNIHLFIAVLAYVATDYSAPTVASDRVASVHWAAPHVSDAVGIHLWSGIFLADERVVRWDLVRFTIGAAAVYIYTQYFAKQSAPKSSEKKLTFFGGTLLFIIFLSIFGYLKKMICIFGILVGFTLALNLEGSPWQHINVIGCAF